MNSKLSDEQKYKIVERYYYGEPVPLICQDTGIARSTLYSWIKLYKVYPTKMNYTISPVEFIKLKQHVQKLEHIIEVLKIVDCTVSSPLKQKLDALEKLHEQYSVHILCEALDVSRGTFYNHIYRNKRENNSYQLHRDKMRECIAAVYHEGKQIYGAQKITAILKERGIATSVKTVSELMRDMNLYSIRTGAKSLYAFMNNENKKKDMLKLVFKVDAPNRAWASDVSAFKLKNKCYYICVIIDLYSRKAVACNISENNSTQLVTSTFRKACLNRRPADNLTFHSDNGRPYTSQTFEKLLKKYSVIHSYSPPGKPKHNAVMEAFFASLKHEELYRTNYRSVPELIKGVERYIQFYNTQRPHGTNNYTTPDAHEMAFYRKNGLKNK